jgi:hypothetical protein
VDALVCLPRHALVGGALTKQAIVAAVPITDVVMAVPIDTCGRPGAHRDTFYEAAVAPVDVIAGRSELRSLQRSRACISGYKHPPA